MPLVILNYLTCPAHLKLLITPLFRVDFMTYKSKLYFSLTKYLIYSSILCSYNYCISLCLNLANYFIVKMACIYNRTIIVIFK